MIKYNRDCLVFYTALVFLAVVPVFVVTGATAGFGLPEGTAKLLAQTSIAIGCFSILVHGKTRIANGIASLQLLRVFCVPFIERDHRIPFVDFLDKVVNIPGIVALIVQEGTLPKRQNGIGGG